MGRRLNLAPAPSARWCDLAAGVRVKLRPLTGIASLAIEAEVATELHALRGGTNVLQRLGLNGQHFGALADPNVHLGVGIFLRAVVTGRALIEDWNVEDDGGPAAITAQSVAALFNEPQAGPQILTSFQAAVEEPLRRQREEGEPSAASPSGTSAQAAVTAADAPRSARRARADSRQDPGSPAPKSSSRRAPRRESQPGAPPSAPAPGGSEK